MLFFPRLFRLAVVLAAVGTGSPAFAQSTIFDSTLPTTSIQGSVGYRANSIDQLGGYAVFTGTDRNLTSGTVQMASRTTVASGAPYQLNLTLSFYAVGAGGAAGAFLTSATQLFNIPATPTDNTSVFFDATFTFAGSFVLPNEVIWTLGFDLGANGSPQSALNTVINYGGPVVGAAGNRDLYLSGLSDNPDPRFATLTRTTVSDANGANAIGAARFNAVPEPGVAVLVGVGLLTLALRARQRG